MSDSQKYIGDKLRLAREEQSKTISDMSEKTNIRKSYVVALEEENFELLPESIYTKNFIKLYARALGIEHEDLISYYESHFQKEDIENVNNIPEYKDFGLETQKSQKALMFWLPLLILAGLLLGAAALWFLNRDFIYKNLPWLNNQESSAVTATIDQENNRESNVAAASQTEEAVLNTEDNLPSNAETTENNLENQESVTTNSGENLIGNTTNTENDISSAKIPDTIKLSIVSHPPGATVNIDNFVMAQKTPIIDAPVSSGKKRLLSISLDGFDSYEEELDLTKDTELVIGLEPSQTVATTEEDGNSTTPTNTLTENTITIKTTAETWLEVWRGNKRNNGEKLVYKVIPAGQEFNFELPVYVHTGNAGGVHIYLGSKDVGKMGSMGEVLGKAFSKQNSE